jgi:hypothetical protein
MQLSNLAAYAPLNLAAPHPVFNLSLHRVGTKNCLRHANLTGWRYFMVSADTALAMVECESSQPGEKPAFARISTGRSLECSVTALSALETSATIDSESYVLGMLRVPGMHAQALWLRNEHRSYKYDLFVPLSSAPTPLPVGEILGTERFLSNLGLAKAALPTGSDA